MLQVQILFVTGLLATEQFEEFTNEELEVLEELRVAGLLDGDMKTLLKQIYYYFRHNDTLDFEDYQDTHIDRGGPRRKQNIKNRKIPQSWVFFLQSLVERFFPSFVNRPKFTPLHLDIVETQKVHPQQQSKTRSEGRRPGSISPSDNFKNSEKPKNVDKDLKIGIFDSYGNPAPSYSLLAPSYGPLVHPYEAPISTPTYTSSSSSLLSEPLILSYDSAQNAIVSSSFSANEDPGEIYLQLSISIGFFSSDSTNSNSFTASPTGTEFSMTVHTSQRDFIETSSETSSTTKNPRRKEITSIPSMNISPTEKNNKLNVKRNDAQNADHKNLDKVWEVFTFEWKKKLHERFGSVDF